jgi:hypothetical protein
MELLTAELRAQLPAIYAQENIKDKMVYAKFFTPDSTWTWYITEGSDEDDDFIFFGYCIGPDPEWGYVSLNELQSARGPLGLPIESDLYFEPAPWSIVKSRHERTHGVVLA